MEIPNRARQSEVDKWCDLEAHISDSILTKYIKAEHELDSNDIGLNNWLEDETDMAALTNFG